MWNGEYAHCLMGISWKQADIKIQFLSSLSPLNTEINKIACESGLQVNIRDKIPYQPLDLVINSKDLVWFFFFLIFFNGQNFSNDLIWYWGCFKSRSNKDVWVESWLSSQLEQYSRYSHCFPSCVCSLCERYPFSFLSPFYAVPRDLSMDASKQFSCKIFTSR